MTHANRSSAALCGLLLATAVHAGALERVPPAASCLDAQDMRELNQISPRSVSLLTGDQSTWRITFTEDCPGILDAATARLEAPRGWACGTPHERVVVDGRHCPVAAVARIPRSEFAAEARQTDRQPMPTLPTVNVAGTRRSFRGSPSYCFTARSVRSWGEDSKGLLVQTNPRTSGGNREYRIEVAGFCDALISSPTINFRSGFQNGLICGNPGDRIEMIQPIDNDPRLNLSSSGLRRHCQILAVYPTR